MRNWSCSRRAQDLASRFASDVHAWAQKKYEPRLNMFAVSLTADAKTTAERDLLVAEAVVFGERFDFDDEGVWLVVETSDDGAHHVHGLLITELTEAEVRRLWAVKVTRAQPSKGAQFVKHVHGSTRDWRTAKTLRTQIHGWICYCLKNGPAPAEDERVLGTDGVLRPMWSSARLSVNRAAAGSTIRRCARSRCGIVLAEGRRSKRYCTDSCRARAHEESPAKERLSSALSDVQRVLERAHDPVPTCVLEDESPTARDAVRAVVVDLATRGEIARHGRGWVLIARPGSSACEVDPGSASVPIGLDGGAHLQDARAVRPDHVGRELRGAAERGTTTSGGIPTIFHYPATAGGAARPRNACGAVGKDGADG